MQTLFYDLKVTRSFPCLMLSTRFLSLMIDKAISEIRSMYKKALIWCIKNSRDNSYPAAGKSASLIAYTQILTKGCNIFLKLKTQTVHFYIHTNECIKNSTFLNYRIILHSNSYILIKFLKYNFNSQIFSYKQCLRIENTFISFYSVTLYNTALTGK